MPLAQELIDLIVAEVQERDNLRRCSLVCRSFRSPAQRELFRAMALRCLPGRGGLHLSQLVSRAGELLTTTPHLATYVQSFTLEIEPAHERADEQGERNIVTIVRCLKQIRHLTLITRTPWKKLPEGIQNCILDSLKLPLRSVVFHIRSMPASILLQALCHFPAVEIGGCIIDQEAEEGHIDEDTIARCVHFSMCFVRPANLFVGRSIKCLQTIRHLRISLPIDDSSSSWCTVATQCSGLECLKIICPHLRMSLAPCTAKQSNITR
ncbi:hypothetical protein B0H11DRAFT_2032613 [Mycena galericulata]|nr:hypothetical protein B0H11DRAFT_2032613 [Mycena galericulata]